MFHREKPTPHPNNGSFSLNFSSATNEQIPLTITNIVGQKVKEQTIPMAIGTTTKDIDIQLNVPVGVYFISAVAGGERLTGKVIVE